MLVQFFSSLFLVAYVACDPIEDVTFLNDAVAKYSPTLVKDLLINRIGHSMNRVKSVNTAVGINQDQRSLCTAIYSSLKVLATDVESLDKSQVICVDSGTSSYTKSIKYFITQFTVLIETFNNQFESLKTPTITQFTPDYLLNQLTSNDTTSSAYKILSNETLTALDAYIEDIEAKMNETTTSYVQRVFASSIVRQLRYLSSEVDDLLTNTQEYRSTFAAIFNQFKQLIDIFYRQFTMLSEVVSSGTSGVELTA